MKVLITGGAGYLGSNLTRHLLEAGYSVTVLDNLMYDQVTLLHLFGNPKFQFELGDVRDKKLLQELVGLNDVIIPLAAIVGMPACKANPELTVAVNYQQVADIVEVLRGDQKLILPNTNSQYGSSDSIITEESPFNPLSLYAKTKCDAENTMLANGNGVSLRLATVFGLWLEIHSTLFALSSGNWSWCASEWIAATCCLWKCDHFTNRIASCQEGADTI